MKDNTKHILCILALLLLTLIFLNPLFGKGRIPNNIHYINDLTFHSYNVKESLKSSEFALWTPYFYAGHPLLAIPENYMLDLNFLFILLLRNIYAAMNFSLIAYFFIAGLGMYILVFNLTENKKASFIAAVIFMFNGFMHSFIIVGHINIIEGYALMPFIVLFVHKALKSKDWIFYSIIAGIFFALQIFSGSVILFFYTALLIFFYMVFNSISKNFVNAAIKSFFVGIVIVAATLGLALIKLLPALEFTKMSSRAVNVSFAEFLGHPIDFKDFFRVIVTSVGYYDISAAIGIIGAILLVFGLFQYRKKLVAFSLLMIIFSLLFASGTFVADVMYKIPGFDKQRHVERALVLFAFAGSVLAAYGFNSLSERLKIYQIQKYEKLIFGGIVFLILLELFFMQPMPPSTKIIEPEEIEVLSYISNDNSIFRTINLAQKDVIGAAGYNYYAQKGISEVKGGGGIWVNDYVNFISIAQQSLSPKMLGILNVKYAVSDTKLESDSMKLIGTFKECKECAVWNAFGPYLYENEYFLPRYHIVPNGILFVGDGALVKQLIYSLMFQEFEPRNSVLVHGTKIKDYDADFLKKFKIIFLMGGSIEQSDTSKLKEFAGNGGIIVPDILNGQNSISNEIANDALNKLKGNYTEIKISKYSNNKAILDLNGQKGWLVASERFAHFPGWKAGINGKYIEIFKANNAISALHLEEEKNDLIFEYKPDSYIKGKLISTAALIVILLYFGYFAYKTKFGGKNQNRN